MKDIAMGRDARGVQLQRVGIKDLHIPLQIRKRENGFQEVLGNVNLSVELPHKYRGTHMSRLVEIVSQWSRKPLGGHDVRLILEQVRSKLDAERADITVRFKYFINKRAPASKSVSALDYDCEFTGSLSGEGFDFILGVEAPIATVCPCSKEISRYGAHNQRGIIRARIRYEKGIFYWIEDLVEQIETLGSHELYPMLKRSDEKYVTEHGYENPKFVEDVLRDAVLMFRGNSRVQWFEVEFESFESIHNHSAYAYQQEWLKEPSPR
ncbi:MAG: GTP cyclohydrolase I FolE2 [Armatimonadetes bacterium]|nr:GTP cyclohydrolase I FolE2 [Armatimonadota bacterium]